jgi:hypothetical protein
MSWSDKYKRSINCDNPSGFSQKAHCAARKKRQRGEETKSKSPFNEMHEIKSHKTVEQIAKKHRLEVSFVKKQLEMGIPIEHEHTKDKDLATDIALQHLDEIPDYYTRLKKMEADAKKHHKKFKDVKEHCGCEDDAVEELESGLKKLDDTSYDSIDGLMRKIMKKHDMTAKQLHNAFVDKHQKTPDDWINEGTLHHWFKGSKSKSGKPGWVQADGSPCANEPGETKTPKCFSSGRLKSLKKKGKKGEALIRSAIRRKRQKDKGQQQKSGAAKPTNVPTFARGKKDKNYVKAEPGIKEAMELNEASKDRPGKGSGNKDACYHKVKARFKVWPSAYASGALVQCRKKGADNWGTKSESTNALAYDWDGPIFENEMRYCPKCKKMEKMRECRYGPKYWSMFSIPYEPSNQEKFNIATVHPANEGYDHEYSMARSELSTIIKAANRLKKKMKKGEGEIEAWVQSKITKAADYIDTAADYVDSGEMNKEEVDMMEGQKCWPGYKKKGTQELFGKKYNRCVKAESVSIEDANGNHYAEFIDIIKPEPLKPTKGIGSALIGEVSPFSPDFEVKKSSGAGALTPSAAAQLGPRAIELQKKKASQVSLPSTAGVKLADSVELKTFQQFMEDWQKVNRQDKTDGLSQAAVDAYRRENPGSKLQTAVTEKKPKGKRAKRRANFCRRMKGMKSKLTSAKTARDPDSRINKALRRWNCN